MLRYITAVLILGLVFAFFGSQPEISNRKHASLTPVVYSTQSADGTDDEKALLEYNALDAEFQAAMAKFGERVTAIEDKEEQLSLLVAENPARDFAKRFIGLANKYPGTKSALKSVLFAVGQTGGAQKNEAMTLLIENYGNKVRLDKMAESFKTEVPSQDIEDWYLLMCKNATKDSIRASVLFDYAKYVSQIPLFRSTLKVNPAIAARLSEQQLEYINSPRTPEQSANVAKALQTIIDELPKVKKGRSTYADLAKRELFDLVRLQVGKEAPDIVGQDLDGIEFRLSDYRGKVVLLDFWGHWCPPCRAMYSHEQEVVRKLADMPFVLIGVNSDRSLETARGAVSSESLSWRHFWNGSKGTKGPIANQWNVEAWPSVYLIDADGVIRHKEVLGKDIDRGLEELMAEMGHKVSLVH